MNKPIILNITKKQKTRVAAEFANTARKGFIAGVVSGNVMAVVAGIVGAKIGEAITENRIAEYAEILDDVDDAFDVPVPETFDGPVSEKGNSGEKQSD